MDHCQLYYDTCLLGLSEGLLCYVLDLEDAKYLTAKYTIEPEPRDIIVFRYGF